MPRMASLFFLQEDEILAGAAGKSRGARQGKSDDLVKREGN